MRKENQLISDIYKSQSFKLSQKESEDTQIAILDERIKSFVSSNKLETLFKSDPLIFRTIHDIVLNLCSSYFLDDIKGSKKSEVEELDKWLNDVGFAFKCQDGIQDIYVNGNWWVEIVADGNNVKLSHINPKTMDFLRDNKTNDVLIDDDGKPTAYVQTVNGVKIIWYKNKVVSEKDDTIIKVSTGNDDLRDYICHFKLFGFGESELGISPLVPTYKSALIRGNLSDMIGEAGFKGGGIVAYTEGVIPEPQRNALLDDLKNINTRNIFVMSNKVKLDTIPIPSTEGREKLIYYYADEVCTGIGEPLALIMSNVDMNSGEREILSAKFEESCKPLQERLSYQIRDKIFKKIWELKGFKGEIPNIVFAEKTPYAKMNRSRTIAVLARNQVIIPDPYLEKQLRKEFDLTIEGMDNKIEQWEKDQITKQNEPQEQPIPTNSKQVTGKFKPNKNNKKGIE
jgi:hypothetical protein